MNILPVTGADPVGAAALLGHADPAELKRFATLEDAVWGKTTLSPAATEAVRLHCAQIRGCEFCKAVRISAAIEDGLSEAQIAHLNEPEARAEFSDEQSAALTLVDHFLLDPRRPNEQRMAEIAATLGTAGVMEVLLACCAFASADLRIALGQNFEPNGSNIFERARGARTTNPTSGGWPVLQGVVLDRDVDFPAVAPELARPIRERVIALWSGNDLSPELVAACIIRSSQMLGVASDDPVNRLLIPQRAATLADAEHVRNWPQWPVGSGLNEMALAERVWMDPVSVNADVTDPLQATLGVDGIIRVTWKLILIGQLHRLALVLHRGA